VTRIDFYILEDMELDAMQRFACRLAAKAVTAGHEVHIHTDDAASANALDELLWAYPQQRFIPHVVVDAEHAPARSTTAPVTLGWQEPEGVDGVLINLGSDVQGFFGRFDRVAEIVLRTARDEGRKRYKFYRDRGYPLFHHQLDDWDAQ
jgi:DNA polymerase-3 subunit chi